MSTEVKEVLFVSNALANGGAARVLCILANWLQLRGVQVTVLVFKSHNAEFPLHPSIQKVYGPHGRGSSLRIQRMRWIRSEVKSRPKAIVVAFEYFVNAQTLLACFGLRNRMIVSERNDPARVGSEFPNDLIRKVLYRRADCLVCQTSEAADYFSDRIRKRVIRNPITPDLPDPAQGPRRKSVVSFCRLEPQKNLGMLVRAFAEFRARHPEYTLEIYGDGQERDSLRSLIAELSLAETATVHPARSDILEVVRECEMFVLPSHYEGLSNSMMEAMAIGVPSICTDVPSGCARAIIQDGMNGILVPPGDESALMAAMDRVAGSGELRRALAENSVKIREQLSVDSIAREWQEVIFD